jgi:hypothetical protein
MRLSKNAESVIARGSGSALDGQAMQSSNALELLASFVPEVYPATSLVCAVNVRLTLSDRGMTRDVRMAVLSATATDAQGALHKLAPSVSRMVTEWRWRRRSSESSK